MAIWELSDVRDNKLDMNSYSLLDVFRIEMETQASVLYENLSILETKPASSQELGSMMRAANAIKGTARLIEIEPAVQLAKAIEDCVVAADKKTITLQTDANNCLVQAVNILVSISRVQEIEIEQWLTENQQEIETINQAIATVTTGGKPNPSQLGNVTISPPQKVHKVTTSENKEIEKKEEKREQEEIITSQISVVSPSQVTVDVKPNPPVSVAPPPTEIFTVGDTSMLELFRLEVDAQAGILNEGLLALEANPQAPKELEALMRAAHSVKGAARIVSLEAAVRLAHVMEDCFVAAQANTIILNSDDVDVLLSGVDLLLQISQVENTNINNWLVEHNQEIHNTHQAISAILTPGTPRPKLETKTQETSETTVKNETSGALSVPTQQETTKELATTTTKTLERQNQPAADQEQTKDREVRVSAENLNRIMGLAGESLIEANWLQPFADSLMILKKRQLELSKILENLQGPLISNKANQDSINYLQSARQKERECREVLSDRISELELFARRSSNLSDRLYREVIASNMRPFTDGVQGFPRMIRDVSRKLGKRVNLNILGKSTPVDRDILKKLEAPLTHILRNAVDHGIELPEERLAKGKPEEGSIRLEASHRGGMLSVSISDDGKGLDPEQLRQKVINKKLAPPEMAVKLTDSELMEFIFLPGFSTAKQVTEISGRGVGLDIAMSMAQEVGGTVRASSQPGKGMNFHFQLPLTLSVIRTLLVEISGESYAFPLARIDQIVMVEKTEIYVAENRQYFTLNGEHIGLIAAYKVLELKQSSFKSEQLAVVIVSDQSNRFGIVVDQVLGERDLVVRPLDSRLGKVPDISAAAIMGDGSPILIVDVSDLVRSIDNLLNSKELLPINGQIETENNVLEERKSILVVDDSITVREMERKILENKGYKVEVAVDGMDGWNAVRTNHYDLVVSDIDMPRMTGIEFVSLIKSHPKLNSLPVIIVSYKDREEDRIKGMEAGANYYLTKSSFQDESFLTAVSDLIGY
jgi:two-component system sensor histidine kinase and response regulator WspE